MNALSPPPASGSVPAASALLADSAAALPAADFLAKSDPYVVVSWGVSGSGEQAKPLGQTATITQNLNPVWTDKERFVVNRLPGQVSQ